MDNYLQIRLLQVDGLSARDIARRLRCGRDTVRKALLNTSPPGYTQTTPRACPKLTEAFRSLILSILKDDESTLRKQRHTAMRLYTRRQDEHGYGGRYDQVRRFMAKHRRRVSGRRTCCWTTRRAGGRNATSATFMSTTHAAGFWCRC